MSAELVLYILLALSVKHLVVDFFLQVPYHYLNKGTYGHFGGIEHAALHGFGTATVLMYFVQYANIRLGLDGVAFLAVLDFFIHYHVDWAKMRLNSKMGWKPDNSEYFWWSLGVDQFLHTFTYLALVWMIVKGIG